VAAGCVALQISEIAVDRGAICLFADHGTLAFDDTLIECLSSAGALPCAGLSDIYFRTFVSNFLWRISEERRRACQVAGVVARLPDRKDWTASAFGGRRRARPSGCGCDVSGDKDSRSLGRGLLPQQC
jgi:hypothetical protein